MAYPCWEFHFSQGIHQAFSPLFVVFRHHKIKYHILIKSPWYNYISLKFLRFTIYEASCIFKIDLAISWVCPYLELDHTLFSIALFDSSIFFFSSFDAFPTLTHFPPNSFSTSKFSSSKMSLPSFNLPCKVSSSLS